MRSIILNYIISGLLLTLNVPVANAQQTSDQITRSILEDPGNRNELIKKRDDITTFLTNPSLVDPAIRQMLTDAKSELVTMIDQKTITNPETLIGLAKWLRSQSDDKISFEETGGTPTPQQQLALANPMAGLETHLVSMVAGILSSTLQKDKDATDPAKLEQLLQAYLNFDATIEHSYHIIDYYMLFTPQWLQGRFAQLTDAQKHMVSAAAVIARADRADGPDSDEDPSTPLSPAQQASYDAVYQFIVTNTPQQ